MLCGGLVTCPTCRTDQGITSAEKLATEYSILAIIAAQQCSKSEMCPQHDVKLAFWCRTCHEPACGECLFEDHPIHVHDVVKSKDHISQLKDLATRRTDSALEVMNGFETKYLYGIFASFAAMCESLKKVMMLHHDMEEGRHILTGILDAEGISAAAVMAENSKTLSEKWGTRESEVIANKNNRMNNKNTSKNGNNNNNNNKINNSTNSNNNNNKVNGNNNSISNNPPANTLKKKKKRRQTSDIPDLVEESTPVNPTDHKGEPVSVAAAAAAVVAAAAAAAVAEENAVAAEKAPPTGTPKAEEPRSPSPPPKPLRVNGAVTAPDFANSRYSIRKTKTLSDLQASLAPLPKLAAGQKANAKSPKGSSNEANITPSRSPTPERKPVKTTAQNKATPEKTPAAAQPSPESQPPPPPPPPPKPETKDASTNTEEEREPTPSPPPSPTPPSTPAVASEDFLIPHPCPESVAIAIAQMEQRLISESTDGQLAKILWEPNGMHVYCHQWQDVTYDLCIKAPLLRSLIPSKNPRVFLDINADDRRLGRVYITLWGHMRRAQNFMILCLGDMGPSYRGAKFFNVYNRGDTGERLVCGDYEYNNGRGGASVVSDLEKSVEQLYPMDEGILVAGSIGRSAMDSMFVICTKGDASRTVACPFGMVTSGLSILQQAAEHYAYAEIWINDCGVLLWESPLQPIEND
ncbi:uncharacterized protein LOC143039566 [Oratosquilla oratoria]|uniref:uncharacterized protein LOC143039566 n=1 Tax=Oratosquilla oratoria TaxID=337810 RepID=UPI003F75C08D